MITYLKGNALEPVGEGYKFILHVCNDEGKWGAGFSGQLSKKWTAPEAMYRRYYKNSILSDLGAVQKVWVEALTWVISMIAMRGTIKTNPAPLHYEYLRTCLANVGVIASSFQEEVSIHMPRIGTGLARGDWSKIEPLINLELGTRPIYVYDLEEK